MRHGSVMARAATLAALFSAGILAVSCGRPAETSAGDGRTAVPLDAEQRLAVLAEMRTLLGSVDGVLRAVVQGDTAAVRAAALASGTAMAADPALETILPPQWLAIATRTHQGFDSLAASVGRGTGDSVVARLARITPECVSCHATYRLP